MAYCDHCKVWNSHRANCPNAVVGTGPVAGTLDIEGYRAFLRRKCEVALDYGFAIEPGEVHGWLKPHQRTSVQWGVRGGRRAIFADFGLGKTVIQLEMLRLILARAGGRALIVAPLGVRQEFFKDAATVGIELRFIRSIEEAGPDGLYLTNYETVRDGKLDPAVFTATSLDEAAILRGFGGTKTFREFMRRFDSVKYRFVATAVPDPNDYIELLAYAAYLGIMDVSAGKTRFFKRDSTKADRLTIHPHKEREWWLWVSSWALFLRAPSDLGFSDEGYALPEMEIIRHEIPVDHGRALPERDGQGRLYCEAMHGVSDAAAEKRNTIAERVACMREIVEDEPDEHFLLWHDLEDERHAIKAALPRAVMVYGAQRAKASELEKLERAIIDFSEGRIQYLGAKSVMFGAGANFQHHCSRAIFVGIGFKFSDFIQAVHRIYRFLQGRPVKIHLIYAESERRILEILMEKWERYKQQRDHMSEIIKQYGLSEAAIHNALMRQMGCVRTEMSGDHHRIVNNDTVEEVNSMATGSVDLILTSIPFSTQYEYSPNYADFGHTSDNRHFFEQMDFLTPNLLRVLKPGRLAAIHVKDRIVPGGITGLGFQTTYPFHVDCIAHFMRHGFAYLGMKTIVTDVVRENKQTYRLGWSEQCKDGTKMGVGMPEYLLIFRKPPTDTANSYADTPVVKAKPDCLLPDGSFVPFDRERPIKPGTGYSRSRWQIDAHGFTRSSGNRSLTVADLQGVSHATIFKLFRQHSLNHVYDFEHHVAIGEVLEAKGILPVTFMLLQPQSWHPDVWTDITRMRTLNGAQSAKGKEMHLCPMQFDLVDRAIEQWSNEGEVVFDPFGGLATVPYRAVLKRRVGVSVELSPSYFLDGCAYVRAAEQDLATPSLFDLLEAEEQDSVPPEVNELAVITSGMDD